MSNNEMLKLLCQRLVANEYETVHDAEQALEQFEQLTTPGLVLRLLNGEADQQHRPYLFTLANDRMGCALDIGGQAHHCAEDSRVESLVLDAGRYRTARDLACGYDSARGLTIVLELSMPNMPAPAVGSGELLDAAIDAYIDDHPKETRHANEA